MAERSVDELLEEAMRLHYAGQAGPAEALYKQVLEMDPNEADALHLLGVLEFQTRRADSALERIRRAIAIDSSVGEYHFNLGLALAELGQSEEAIASYRRAISLKNNFPEACNSLGVSLAKNGIYEEAIVAFRQALALSPDYPDASNNLGNALTALEQFDEAIACYHKAIIARPNYPEAFNNLGIALQSNSQLDESIGALRQALALRPNYPEALNNLGKSLQIKGESQEAVEACRKAIELRPDYGTVHGTLGNALKDLGRVEEAIASYRTALKFRPDLYNTHSSLLFAMHYDPNQTPQAIFQEHLRWNEQFAEPLEKREEESRPHSNDRNPDRPLRIGYVSPDFCAHSLAYFLENLLANHDPEQVDIFCYVDLIHPDAVTERLKKLAPHWRDTTKLKNHSVADLVRNDQIDILVDLSGHTAYNRLLLFARKPAPLQVSYLGYPDTSGLKTIDYRISDAYADPAGWTEQFHTETLVRLSDSFLCFRPSADSPAVSSLPAIKNGHITFGSLNILPKITPNMLKVWGEILRQVTGSRLIIKSYIGFNSEEARQRILNLLIAEGIDSSRIELHAKIPSRSAYLAIYDQIDIALDTYPYHGTTMTCESLWMGVPVITLAGKTHVSRVGVSLLSNMGLRRLIAQSPGEYVQIARDLARNISELAKLRAGLRQTMAESPVTNGSALARNMEAAYRRMWRDYLMKSD